VHQPPGAVPPHTLRLVDAGDAKPAWITLPTTEHYILGMQRAATISEVNGRASIFVGAVSAGLIALGFEGAENRHSAGSAVFAVLVLTPLLFLGLVTFGRCLPSGGAARGGGGGCPALVRHRSLSVGEVMRGVPSPGLPGPRG
jgi:hypothetical protein